MRGNTSLHSCAVALLRDSQKQIDRKRYNHEDETKGKAEREISLAGFECNGGGHGARVQADIAAQHHGHADLGDNSSKTRNDGGDKPEADFAPQLEEALQIARPERAGGRQNAFIRALNRTEGVIGNHWNGKNCLSDDDGSWRKYKSQRTERPLPAEETVYQKPDDYGGHRHKAIQEKADRSFHRKLGQCHGDS